MRPLPTRSATGAASKAAGEKWDRPPAQRYDGPIRPPASRPVVRPGIQFRGTGSGRLGGGGGGAGVSTAGTLTPYTGNTCNSTSGYPFRHRPARGETMDCAEFLENYSDLLDRRFESRTLAEYREHLVGCPSCTAYDRMVQRGLVLVRELPPPEPGPDFAPRLQHRLFHLQDQLQRREGTFVRVSAVTALAAAALAFMIWLPSVGSNAGPLQLPPVVVTAPARTIDVPTLWNGSAVFGTVPRLLLVPEFPRDPWRVATEGRLLLFRAPLRAAKPPRESASQSDAE